MNQLLLLGGLVLAIYIMNEKKMFKSLSLGKDSTVLIALFCGVILFMCMRKKVEGLTDEKPCGEDNSLHMVQVLTPDAYKPVSVCVPSNEVGILTAGGKVMDDTEKEPTRNMNQRPMNQQRPGSMANTDPDTDPDTDPEPDSKAPPPPNPNRAQRLSKPA